MKSPWSTSVDFICRETQTETWFADLDSFQDNVFSRCLRHETDGRPAEGGRKMAAAASLPLALQNWNPAQSGAQLSIMTVDAIRPTLNGDVSEFMTYTGAGAELSCTVYYFLLPVSTF